MNSHHYHRLPYDIVYSNSVLITTHYLCYVMYKIENGMLDL